MELIETEFPLGKRLKLLPHRATGVQDHRTWEAAYLAAIFGYLKPGMVVYDIGTEAAEFSCLVAQVVGGSNVHLIEPAPTAWPGIRATWEANVDGAPGGCWAGFFAAKRTGVPGKGETEPWPLESAGPIATEAQFGCYAEHPHIPSTSLDEYADASYSRPDVLLIDVEGAEELVLIGADDMLDGMHSSRPEVFLAVHPPEWLARYGSSLGSIGSRMRAIGYRGSLIDSGPHELHVRYTPAERA